MNLSNISNKIKLTTTPRFLLDTGLWERFCELANINPRCVNEGLMSDRETLEIPAEMLQQVIEKISDVLSNYDPDQMIKLETQMPQDNDDISALKDTDFGWNIHDRVPTDCDGFYGEGFDSV